MGKRKHPTEGPCAQCGRVFAYKDHQQFSAGHGRPVLCSRACRITRLRKYDDSEYDETGTVKGAGGPVRGPCEVCGEMYRSQSDTRKFCSMDCYMSSPSFRLRLREHNRKQVRDGRIRAGFDPDKTPEVVCDQCGESFTGRTKRLKNQRFCSKHCYRSWLADRFDRWVANPKSVALPQCYDEFFSGETLECTVDGCDWEGRNLAHHVNLAHGVTADEFRELLGCNKGTGLVTHDLSEFRRDVALANDFGSLRGEIPTSRHRGSPRLEGKEHRKKTMALRPETLLPPVDCEGCGVTFRPKIGQHSKRFCTIDCRTEHHRRHPKPPYRERRSHPLVCANCSKAFLGTHNQQKRHRRALTAFCSKSCSAKHRCRAAALKRER